VAFLNQFPFFQSDPAKRNQGIIDPTKINGVSKNYIAAGLIPSATNGTLFPTGGSKNDNDELTGKFDAVLTSKDRLAVTLGSLRNPQLNPFSVEANVPGFPTSTLNHRYFAGLPTPDWFPPISSMSFASTRSETTISRPCRRANCRLQTPWE